MTNNFSVIARWWLVAAWRMQPGRWIIAIIAIASGVAMALAIHLVNGSALDEFRDAIARVNGNAQLQLVSPLGLFDEAVWPVIASAPEVGESSPVLDLRLGASRQDAYRVIGIDVMRAARVTPALLPTLDEDRSGGSLAPLFAADQVFLSEQARRQFGSPVNGDLIEVVVGLGKIVLEVAGSVALDDRILLMDLATAQWRFDALGRLSRVDLRLNPGLPRALAIRKLQDRLAQAGFEGLELLAPDASVQRMSNLSRAYRVNLSVLALVALFTGAFLVWTALTLAVRRQRAMLALLGVLGMTPGQVAALVALQGLSVALIGSLLGLGLGILAAQGLLLTVGGDLGGGYFSGAAHLRAEPATLLIFAALGTAVGAVASWAPARASSSIVPIQGLRDTGGEAIERGATRPLAWWSLSLFAAGAALLQAPTIEELPIPSYLAIACWLLAGIIIVPVMASILAKALTISPERIASATRETMRWRHPPLWLAMMRVGQAPAQATGVVAGVVASFALGCAMAIMVQSFRDSVVDWLDGVLPAELYLRAPSGGGSAAFSPAMQASLRAVPGIARIEFLRSRELILDPQRPAIALLARQINRNNPGADLPLTGATIEVPSGAIPIWISEPLARRDGLQPGMTMQLPLMAPRNASAPPPTGVDRPGVKQEATQIAPSRDTTEPREIPSFVIAGVWRDYSRQHGSIVIGAGDYQRLTGDDSVSDAAIWLEPGADANTVTGAVQASLPSDARFDLRSAAQIRSLSLTIFDRSFAVTYALEAAAIGVGLIGVAAAFGGQALARRREFGILRHLGATRAQLRQQIMLEAGTIATLGVLWGGVVGSAIAAILVFQVNPQSFHWTMNWSVPWGLLLATGTILIGAAMLAALLATRQALTESPVNAVREDW